jgi:hypothetical protein
VVVYDRTGILAVESLDICQRHGDPCETVTESSVRRKQRGGDLSPSLDACGGKSSFSHVHNACVKFTDRWFCITCTSQFPPFPFRFFFFYSLFFYSIYFEYSHKYRAKRLKRFVSLLLLPIEALTLTVSIHRTPRVELLVSAGIWDPPDDTSTSSQKLDSSPD